jgi:hypothetical protein
VQLWVVPREIVAKVPYRGDEQRPEAASSFGIRVSISLDPEVGQINDLDP